ncbi:hypothetical protein [Roseomonas sp. BN140053]|uniref:hypothetical protein n=1 Tax=Roseomonas sp. BN140053 TaxID=3391898 RepID=UPI0039E990E0
MAASTPGSVVSLAAQLPALWQAMEGAAEATSYDATAYQRASQRWLDHEALILATPPATVGDALALLALVADRTCRIGESEFQRGTHAELEGLALVTDRVVRVLAGLTGEDPFAVLGPNYGWLPEDRLPA